MPDLAGATGKSQRRIVAGLWLPRKAVIAETDGDFPLRFLRVRYLDFVFVKVRQVIGIPLVGKRRPALFLKIRTAHEVPAIKSIPAMVRVRIFS